MLVGSFCFLFLLPRLRQVRIRRRDLRYLVLMAVCEPCIYFIFEAKAMELTTASQAGMITAILPLLVAIGATIFHGERIARQTIAGFALAWSLFQLWYASPLPFIVGFGILNDTEARAIHLAFAMFLAFLAWPALSARRGTASPSPTSSSPSSAPSAAPT